MAVRVGELAPDFTVLSADGESVSLSDHRGRWVVLVFLRWLGWLHWADHLAQLRQQQAALDAKGAEVLVVSFDPSRRIRGYCRRLRLPFRCLSDEQRAAYRAFGLGRGSWLRTLTPKALAPYLRLYLQRGGPRPAYGGQDLRQMGGDFVVAPDGRVAFAYASHDPADRPPVDDLLAAIR